MKNNSSGGTNYYSANNNSSLLRSPTNKIKGDLKFNHLGNKNTMYFMNNKLGLLHLLALVLAILLFLYLVIGAINYFYPLKFIPKSNFFPTQKKDDN